MEKNHIIAILSAMVIGMWLWPDKQPEQVKPENAKTSGEDTTMPPHRVNDSKYERSDEDGRHQQGLYMHRPQMLPGYANTQMGGVGVPPTSPNYGLMGEVGVSPTNDGVATSPAVSNNHMYPYTNPYQQSYQLPYSNNNSQLPLGTQLQMGGMGAGASPTSPNLPPLHSQQLPLQHPQPPYPQQQYLPGMGRVTAPHTVSGYSQPQYQPQPYPEQPYRQQPYIQGNGDVSQAPAARLHVPNDFATEEWSQSPYYIPKYRFRDPSMVEEHDSSESSDHSSGHTYSGSGYPDSPPTTSRLPSQPGYAPSPYQDSHQTESAPYNDHSTQRSIGRYAPY